MHLIMNNAVLIVMMWLVVLGSSAEDVVQYIIVLLNVNGDTGDTISLNVALMLHAAFGQHDL